MPSYPVCEHVDSVFLIASLCYLIRGGLGARLLGEHSSATIVSPSLFGGVGGSAIVLASLVIGLLSVRCMSRRVPPISRSLCCHVGLRRASYGLLSASLAPGAGEAVPVPEPYLVGKILGKSLCMGVRIIGRQAQTTAVLASMVVHIVLFRVPNVVSWAFEAGSSVVKRRMLVAKTNTPRPNTSVRPMRWRVESDSDQTTPGTDARITKSVTML